MSRARPTCSARSACRPARTAAPPAPTRSWTCSCSAAAADGAQPPRPELGEHAAGRRSTASRVRINAWLAERPEMILGAHSTVGARHVRADTLHRPRRDATARTTTADRCRQLAAAARAITARRRRPTAARATTPPCARARRDASQRWRSRRRASGTGTSSPAPDGRFATVADGAAGAAVRSRARRRASCGLLLELRDSARALLAAEAASARGHARARRSSVPGCATSYSPTYARYGPVNRYTLRRTGRTDPETGEERMRADHAAGGAAAAAGTTRSGRWCAPRELRRRDPDRDRRRRC